MCTKSSNFPWDMTLIKQGNLLILDSELDREPISFIDLNCVNQNAQDLLPDEEKDIYDLTLESTKIQNALQTQAFVGEPWEFSDERQIPVQNFQNQEFGLRYVEWKVDNFFVKVRVKIDGYITTTNADGEPEKKPCILRTLNENMGDVDWRKSIQTSKGSFRSKEFINNSNNFNRWLCSMELAQVDNLKIGYVARSSISNKKHNILFVDSFTYKEIKQSTKFEMKDCWSVVKYICQTFT